MLHHFYFLQISCKGKKCIFYFLLIPLSKKKNWHKVCMFCIFDQQQTFRTHSCFLYFVGFVIVFIFITTTIPIDICNQL